MLLYSEGTIKLFQTIITDESKQYEWLCKLWKFISGEDASNNLCLCVGTSTCWGGKCGHHHRFLLFSICLYLAVSQFSHRLKRKLFQSSL